MGRRKLISPSRWRADKDGKYYFVQISCIAARMTRDYDFDSDREKYTLGNYFKSGKAAEAAAAAAREKYGKALEKAEQRIMDADLAAWKKVCDITGSMYSEGPSEGLLAVNKVIKECADAHAAANADMAKVRAQIVAFIAAMPQEVEA